MQDSLKKDIVVFYQNLIENDSEELRKRAVYNLPYFFHETYKLKEDGTENSEDSVGEDE